MNGVDLFHVGIVVDDVESTLVALTELFGYTWTEEIGGGVPVGLPTGEVTIDLRSVYSKTVPRLEVVKAVPGTLWTPVEGSGIHHLGYWSSDVEADEARLVDRGYTVEARGVRPGGTTYWGYYRCGDGPRIELVSRELQSVMETIWS